MKKKTIKSHILHYDKKRVYKETKTGPSLFVSNIVPSRSTSKNLANHSRPTRIKTKNTNYLWMQSILLQFSYHNLENVGFSLWFPLFFFSKLRYILYWILVGFNKTATAFITMLQCTDHNVLCLGSEQFDFKCACAETFFYVALLSVFNLFFFLNI